MTPSRSERREQSQEMQDNWASSAAVPTRSRDAASPGARATARWRRRKAQGSFIVPVELFDYEIEVLIRTGYLERAEAGARDRIGLAVSGLVWRVLDRTARSRGYW